MLSRVHACPRIMLGLLLFALALASWASDDKQGATPYSYVDGVPIFDVSDPHSIGDLRVLRWHDPSGTLTIDELPHTREWALTGTKAPAGKAGTEWVWFKLTNLSNTTRRTVVSFDEVFPEEANFYVSDKNGERRVFKNGLQKPIPARDIKTRVPAIDLAVQPGQELDVWLSNVSRLEAVLGVQVQPPAKFAAWVEAQTAGFAFFLGGAIAIIVFNLFLFASIKDSLYLIYSLHASLVVMFVARFSGFTFYFFDTPEQHYILATSTWIQAAFLVVFTRRLLDTASLNIWIDRALFASQLWFVAVAIATIIDIQLYRIGVRSSLFFTLCYLGVGIYSAYKGNPLGTFFSIAQTPYLIGYFLLAGASIGILEASFLTRYGFIIGTFLELVTFSLALGYRFRMLERDKFNSQSDLLSLQGSLNQQLKDQVDNRTRELAVATEELQSINSDYEALLQSVAVGVASIDAQGDVTFSNQAYLALNSAIPSLSQTINQYIAEKSSAETDELVIPSPSGADYHVLLNTAERFTKDGADNGFWVVATDVTDMRIKEASLNQATKMATLGEMSTGMAHELNQPLNVIRLTMENVRRKLHSGEITQDFLLPKFERIDDQVNRASKLISLMRTFGRVAPSAFEPFDVIESTYRAVDLMEEQLRLEQITINVVQPSSSTLVVNGSSSQFEQVIFNLISNSRDAINRHSRSGGRITINIEDNANTCLISISDTGGGLADHVINRIFEPFFTTKAVGEGTGLGGAISYGIVNDMRGSITARNTSVGAAFDILLPLLQPVQEA